MLRPMELATLLATLGPIVAGYFIGAMPFGIVVAKIVGGPDPRTLGSGRTGGANVVRALGPRAGLVAGLLDAAKGSVSVLIAILVGGGPIVEVLAALAAILGHSRSIYIRFGGGRGIAPAFGALLVMQPLVALLAFVVFLAVLILSRISSLASLTAATVASLALIAAVVLLHMHPAYAGYGAIAAVMIWVFHRDNVERLIAGRERRIEWRR
jgi:glycerol-3-phosphate acyltransferase PlsY